jgi:hypothetical protein
MQLRELCVVGPGKEPARLRFEPGGNVVSGDSDTGKSYILRCIDFLLGAEGIDLREGIEEANGYEQAFLEFENEEHEFVTFVRQLSGGDVIVYKTQIAAIHGSGETIACHRHGKSTAPDITSVLLPFAGMAGEGKLRSSAEGKKQRLTVRLLHPLFLVDETSIIAQRSPILAEGGYDETARKRMFSYLLTGLDDSEVVAAESRKIVKVGAQAKLALIEELLRQVEERLKASTEAGPEERDSITERVDEAIQRLSTMVAEDREKQVRLQRERAEARDSLQHSETQIIALDEMLSRYRLLDDRYASDLKRLDFVSEGAHYFDALQDVHCPVCGQLMDVEHRHLLDGSENASTVYEAARAEAAKILGLRADLAAAAGALRDRRAEREGEKSAAISKISEINNTVDREIAPALENNSKQLDALIQRRLALQAMMLDQKNADGLRKRKSQLEDDIRRPAKTKKWAGVDSAAAYEFCREVEAVLAEWEWKGDGRVEFEEKSFDIKVDGKPRQSHGKGVRAILHAAFIVGLLRYSHTKEKPHPGFIVLDSPLTTLKKGKPSQGDELNDPGIEYAFWKSLTQLTPSLQIIVLENKEPPVEMLPGITYTLFAGEQAAVGERRGFLPPNPKE